MPIPFMTTWASSTGRKIWKSWTKSGLFGSRSTKGSSSKEETGTYFLPPFKRALFTIYHRTGLIRSLQPPTPPKSRPLIWFFPPHPDLLVGDSRSDSGPFSQELFFYISHFWPPEKTPRPNPGDWKNPT